MRNRLDLSSLGLTLFITETTIERELTWILFSGVTSLYGPCGNGGTSIGLLVPYDDPVSFPLPFSSKTNCLSVRRDQTTQNICLTPSRGSINEVNTFSYWVYP